MKVLQNRHHHHIDFISYCCKPQIRFKLSRMARCGEMQVDVTTLTIHDGHPMESYPIIIPSQLSRCNEIEAESHCEKKQW